MVRATDRMRAILNSLRHRKGVIITQSYLRLEVLLGNTGALQFQILQNQQSQTLNERRLAITDSFLITALCIAIYKQGAGQAISAVKLRTYPNSNIFAGAGEADALQAIYNGFLTLRVNSTVYIDSLDIYRFYRVGTAQEGLNTTVPGAGIISAYNGDDYPRGDYPFYGITPSILVSGATKNEINLQLPDSVNMTAPAGQNNFAVCYMRGLLLQNAAQFNPRQIDMAVEERRPTPARR